MAETKVVRDFLGNPFLGQVSLCLDEEGNILLRVVSDGGLKEEHGLGNLNEVVRKMVREGGEDNFDRNFVKAIKFVREMTDWDLPSCSRYVRAQLWKPFFFGVAEIKSPDIWELLVVRRYRGDIKRLKGAKRFCDFRGTPHFSLCERSLSAEDETLGEWADANHMNLKL